MYMYKGNSQSGARILEFDRPWKCPIDPCKCCCFQQVIVRDQPSEKEIGVVIETFYCCVPTFNVHDAEGNQKFSIHQHPGHCFGLFDGCCVNGCFGYCFGSCCIGSREPFDVYETKSGRTAGQIIKDWTGFFRATYEDADTFQIKWGETYTNNPNPDDTALLIGATLLINQIFFEGELEPAKG